MKRFFDFSPALWDYFQELDRRFGKANEADELFPSPAEVACYGMDLSGIRVVLWDVYGTLCGVELGDLEKTLEDDERLLAAAKAIIGEFSLQEPLKRMRPDQLCEITLRDLYRQMIEDSHLRSLATGVEYPEVVIEQIWLAILQVCVENGLAPPENEPPLHTAYRWAYFFDWSVQRNYLYRGVGATLSRLKQAGLIQGIISNGQFYTPLQLRRLLREDLDKSDLELEEYFSEPLVLFSYEMGFSKPNPRVFSRALEVIKRQGIAPEEILYVGNDMLNDIWAASRWGIRTVLFVGDSRQTALRKEEARCRDLQPDGVVSELGRIAELILGC